MTYPGVMCPGVICPGDIGVMWPGLRCPRGDDFRIIDMVRAKVQIPRRLAVHFKSLSMHVWRYRHTIVKYSIKKIINHKSKLNRDYTE